MENVPLAIQQMIATNHPFALHVLRLLSNRKVRTNSVRMYTANVGLRQIAPVV